MCFGPSTLGAGAKTRLESRIKKFTPHYCKCTSWRTVALLCTPLEFHTRSLPICLPGMWQATKCACCASYIATGAARVVCSHCMAHSMGTHSLACDWRVTGVTVLRSPHHAHRTILTVPCHAIPYSPCHAVPYQSLRAILCHAVPYHTHRAMPCHTILSVPSSPYHALAVPCCAMLLCHTRADDCGA